MVDYTQVIILTVTVIITVLLTIIGVQLIIILQRVRRLLDRFDMVTGHIEKLGMSLSGGYMEILGFIAGVGKLFRVVDTIASSRKKSTKTANS